LRQLELEIERNLTGFIKCGRALLEVRESRLYREKYPTFAAYCRERFALARSTADQLCRSTQVFETLSANAELTGTPAPPDTIGEIVLRPLCALPGGDEIKAQTWRLAALLSPEGRPTRTIAARISRLVRSALGGKTRDKKGAQARDVMFVRPIQRLAVCPSFDPQITCLHVRSPEQAVCIIASCQTVADRCRQIEEVLAQKFSLTSTASPLCHPDA
jgi:hypothetical protein